MNNFMLRNRRAYTLDRETAPAIWLVETLWFLHAAGAQTDNRFTLLEQVMPRGVGPPAHRHPLAVEGFYVLEGNVDFHVDGEVVPAEAGTLIHLPRMKPHTFAVKSEEARVLNFYTPAGSEIQGLALAHPAEERRRPTMAESAPPKNDELNRILSRLYGSVAVKGLPFSTPPAEDLLVTEPGVWAAGTVKVATPVEAPVFDAFGLHWRLLAAGADTGDDYDLFDVTAEAGAEMPARILGSAEALYVLEGTLTLEADGQANEAGVGSFTYAPAGTLLRWQATGDTRLLVFHLPGGFDRALVGGHGQDALVAAWLESTGTRFLSAMTLPETALAGDS